MLLEIILLLLAIPIGYLIAYLTPEELKDGRKYFKAIIIISILAAIWFFIVKKPEIACTALFIAITTIISLKRSYNKSKF